MSRKEGSASSDVGLKDFDYWCFHCPYTKLVQKSFGRLVCVRRVLIAALVVANMYSHSLSLSLQAFNDFLRNPAAFPEELREKFGALQLEETYFNRDVEKAFVGVTAEEFKAKVGPALVVAKNVGNMYCGSLYGALTSLLGNVDDAELVGCSGLLVC